MTRFLPILLPAILVLGAMPGPAAGAGSLSLSTPGGAVAFTFDGGYATHMAAASTLESKGFRGTFYVVSGNLGAGKAYLTAQQVADLAARGHDIESHTVTHPDLTTVSDDQLAHELADSQSALEQITGEPVLHLAYPYGAVDARVASAASTYYATGRVVTTSLQDFTPSVDPYDLPGLMVMKSTTLAKAESYVDYAVSHNVAVVLSFESITKSPGAYDWTPAKLTSLVAYVAQKGVAVETVAQLAPSAAPPPPPPPPTPTSSGTLVFTFDDGWYNQIQGAQILAEHGYRGTFFIVPTWLQGSRGAPEENMGTADVVDLSSAGHDIESHTWDHPDLTTLTTAQMDQELSQSQAYLQDLVGKPVRHLAYPYGAYDDAVVQETSRYYASGRGYQTDLAAAGPDPYRLVGVGIVATTTLSQAEADVDFAIANNVTLVLTFHDLRDAPREYDWTPAQFQALVDYVAAKQPRVETMAQAEG